MITASCYLVAIYLLLLYVPVWYGAPFVSHFTKFYSTQLVVKGNPMNFEVYSWICKVYSVAGRSVA